MIRPVRALVAALALTAACAATASAAAPKLPAPPTVGRWSLTTVMSGLAATTSVDTSADGSVFATTQGGQLWARYAGRPAQQRLLDWSSRVNMVTERGLSDLAVTPDSTYARSTVYLLYAYDPPGSRRDSSAARTARLSVVTFVRGHLTSERTVLGSAPAARCHLFVTSTDCLSGDGVEHNVGTVLLDPDGTLWVGMGDSQVVDPDVKVGLRSQETKYANGKILHVTTSGRGVPGHPFCPTAPRTDTCAKVFARGFRNPWRFQLDPADPGHLLVGDVGDATWEELDEVGSGFNGGWPCWESTIFRPWILTASCTTRNDLPTWTYGHNATGASIIGGPRFPAGWGSLTGRVLVGDFTRSTMQLVNTGVTPATAVSFWNGLHATNWTLRGSDLYVADWGSGGGPDGRVLQARWLGG